MTAAPKQQGHQSDSSFIFHHWVNHLKHQKYDSPHDILPVLHFILPICAFPNNQISALSARNSKEAFIFAQNLPLF
ncbi:hypothetical protein GVN20_18655 [Runella sp. CRIBMP]|nr:hypothetical protein [Runella sp. CRIBMP]